MPHLQITLSVFYGIHVTYRLFQSSAVQAYYISGVQHTCTCCMVERSARKTISAQLPPYYNFLQLSSYSQQIISQPYSFSAAHELAMNNVVYVGLWRWRWFVFIGIKLCIIVLIPFSIQTHDPSSLSQARKMFSPGLFTRTQLCLFLTT